MAVKYFITYGVAAAVWIFLNLIPVFLDGFWFIAVVSNAFLAISLSSWGSTFFTVSKKRENIENTSDKGIFITGCDSGFGLSLAESLAELGFKVYAGCLDPEGEGPTSLRSSLSHDVITIQCDVTNEEQVRRAFLLVSNDLILSQKTLWAVVNNAGIASMTEIEWCSMRIFRQLLEVNALGPVLITKTFLPLLRESGGRIVIMASLAGRHTFFGYSAYSMSKHAVVSFADGLRLEMKKWNISVHTIEPTLYKTPIAEVGILERNVDRNWQESTEEIRKSYGQQYLDDFKVTMKKEMDRAKPVECIKEVVADMVDAVCGKEPENRYVPSMKTQLVSNVMSNLPEDLKESLYLRNSPKTPTAFTEERRKKPSLQDPRVVGPGGKRMKRHFSTPNYERSTNTPPPPPPTARERNVFFDEDE